MPKKLISFFLHTKACCQSGFFKVGHGDRSPQLSINSVHIEEIMCTALSPVMLENTNKRQTGKEESRRTHTRLQQATLVKLLLLFLSLTAVTSKSLKSPGMPGQDSVKRCMYNSSPTEIPS